MILRTYARVFTSTPDVTVFFLERLVGRPADLRFTFGDLRLAAVGDFLVLGGRDEALLPFRAGVGPVVVDDLTATIRSQPAGCSRRARSRNQRDRHLRLPASPRRCADRVRGVVS